MKAAAFAYRAAASEADAVALLAAAGDAGKVIGGSQSLGPMLNLRLAYVEQLVGVRGIASLQSVTLADDTLRIGSGVTHAMIEDGALPDVTMGLLPAVAQRIAYRAVRNRGTLGGSLAHADPAADWVSVMRLLNARLHLLGPAGPRSVMADAFWLGAFTPGLAPDEIIVAVELPRFAPGARWAYRKLCRKPGEFADAIAAVWVDPARGVARVLLGALDGMPHVMDDAAALAALQSPATRPDATTQLLDDAGLNDPDARALHAEMLRRALADLDRFGPGPGAQA